VVGRPILVSPLAIIDCEMTGLDPQNHRVIEVAVVLIDGDQREEWSSLVFTDVKMEPEAVGIHKITSQDLVDAPSFAAIAPQLRAMLTGRIVVGHKISFDLEFLEHEWQRLGQELPEMLGTIDTLELARRRFCFPSNRLSALVHVFSIENAHPHRALGDAVATTALLMVMLQIIDEKGILSLVQLQAVLAELSPGSAPRKARKEALVSALKKGQPVEISYQSVRPPAFELTHRVVDLTRVKRSLVTGFCRLRNGDRKFRFDRILSVKMVD
jgi:DNA polymerase III epsilon subunit family exonuclease